MIYDCFTFFNELDLLEIRLNVLNDVVDRFVLVEATKTHSNKNKPLFYWENKDRYKLFADKIIYVRMDEYPDFTSSWLYENLQRNMIMKGLESCKPDDIIIISDLDEIPSPLAISRYNLRGIQTFEQQIFIGFLNYKSVIYSKWYGSNILQYKDFSQEAIKGHVVKYSTTFLSSINEGVTPTRIRMIRDFPIIKKGGWHFTYMGGIHHIQYKLESFAHQEFNKDEFTSLQVIENKIKKGYDLINPGENRCVPVLLQKNLPQYIVDNQDKYTELLYPVNYKILARNLVIILVSRTKYILILRPIKLLRKIKKQLWKK